MDANQTEIQTAIEESLIELPNLPHTFVQAMELSKKTDDITIEEVVDIVRNDPLATTRILSIVNSTYYGLRQEVTNIRKAVITLGPGTVTSILMSISLIDLRTALDASFPIPFIDLVRHSIATAFLARQITSMSILQELDSEGREDYLNQAFTAGLLHDFGKLVLIHNFPEKAARIYEAPVPITTKDNQLLRLEQNTFGFDHAQMGAYMMRSLNMPEPLCYLIEGHHHRVPPTEMGLALRILHGILKFANRLASNLGFTYNRKVASGALYEDPLIDLLLKEQVFRTQNKETLFDELMNVKSVLREYVETVV